MTAIFLEGNAMSVLPNLPADFFHCAVTSPPFYGLRKYLGGEKIWDGDGSCEHEWMDGCVRQHSGSSASAKQLSVRGAFHGEMVTGCDLCSKCGAWKGQLGAEPTPDLYISHLIQVMREVKRVLRPDGVFWINIGDSWASGKGTCFNPGGGADSLEGHARLKEREAYPLDRRNKSDLEAQGMKPLDMILIPSLLAIAARADGWYVRSMVVWSKGNCMPESVNGWRFEQHRVRIKARTRGSVEGSMPLQSHHPGQVPHRDGSFGNPSDTEWQDCPGCPKCSPNDGYVLRKGSWRPTDSYEFILMLTKTNHYYCDREAVVEQAQDWGTRDRSKFRGGTTDPLLKHHGLTDANNASGGRNLRSVWLFPTSPGKFQHYAAYPPRLPETCIKASTSEKGCCPKCGSPWARVVERTGHINKREPAHVPFNSPTKTDSTGWSSAERAADLWRPTCQCQCQCQDTDPPISCRVLDPFSGAGTTALVAQQLGLDSISIDTSPEYIQMSKDRLADDEQKRIDEFIKRAKQRARNSKNSKPLPT